MFENKHFSFSFSIFIRTLPLKHSQWERVIDEGEKGPVEFWVTAEPVGGEGQLVGSPAKWYRQTFKCAKLLHKYHEMSNIWDREATKEVPNECHVILSRIKTLIYYIYYIKASSSKY